MEWVLKSESSYFIAWDAFRLPIKLLNSVSPRLSRCILWESGTLTQLQYAKLVL